MVRVRPVGCLESRTATPGGVGATSTQPPLLPLKELFRHPTSTHSPLPPL